MGHNSLVSVAIGGMLALTFGAGLTGAGPSDEPASAESKDRPHVRFRIITEHTELVPGTTQTLGLVFTMEPQWHVYYKGAAGGGNPPSIDEASLPKGYALGEIQWPAPKRYVAPGGIYDSVYEGEVVLLVPLTVPATATPGEKAKIGLKMSWLECSDVCVFGRGEDTKTIPIAAANSKPARSADAPLLDKSRALLPKPWPTQHATADLADGTLSIQFPGAKKLEFYPGPESSDIEGLADSTVANAEKMKLRFADANKNQIIVDGVLGVWPADGKSPSFFSLQKRSSN